MGWIRLGLCLLALWGCSPSTMHHRALENRFEGRGFEARIIEVGPHRVHTWVGGAGPPVLLIHGFGGDGLVTWSHQAKALAKTHTVIIPDLLWFGDSDSTAPPGLDVQSEAILGALAVVVAPENPVDVVGISYGGFVALRMGTLAPERFRRLVVMDSPGPLFTPEEESALLRRFGVERAEEIFVPEGPDQVRVLLELAYHHPPPTPRWVLRDVYRQVFSAHHEEQTALLHDLASGRERYAGLAPAPYEAILVVWGRHDLVFPVQVGERLAAALGAEFLVVEGAAHAPNVEKAAAVNAGLVAFLKDGSN